MKPGDLIKVDPVDWKKTDEKFGRRILLTKLPEPIENPGNAITGRLVKDEVGIVVATQTIETHPRDGWQLEGKHLEVLVLFGERLGWNSSQCFSLA